MLVLVPGFLTKWLVYLNGLVPLCADVDFSPKTFNLIFPHELLMLETKKN